MKKGWCSMFDYQMVIWIWVRPLHWGLSRAAHCWWERMKGRRRRSTWRFTACYRNFCGGRCLIPFTFEINMNTRAQTTAHLVEFLWICCVKLLPFFFRFSGCGFRKDGPFRDNLMARLSTENCEKALATALSSGPRSRKSQGTTHQVAVPSWNKRLV